MKLFYLKEKIY